MVKDNAFESSHFHSAEVAIQERLGIAKELAANTRGFIRPAMPLQHRQFFEQLPLIILAVADKDGRPWATPVFGRPGFISSPDDRHLVVNQLPALKNELQWDLTIGQKMGLLGIELPTRRRNRMNGHIASLDDNQFTIHVEQSFGNCPQYIQQRELQWQSSREHLHNDQIYRSSALSPEAKLLIDSADTFFIASRTSEFNDDPRTGLDASHRGGRPGFVKVDAQSITFPDFSGNRFFNTLGNIQADGRAGLFFPNFISGDAVFITGRASIIWDESVVSQFEGAERLVTIDIDDCIYVEQFMPLTGELIEAWPYLESTGRWSDIDNQVNTQASDFRELTIVRKVAESQQVSSFYLKPKDEMPLHTYIAGQFLPIKLRAENGEWLYRNYTLSQADDGEHYRISVKKEAQGLVSSLLHERFQVGDVIDAAKPLGRFTLQHNDHQVVMLSAGVGITPMIAMLETLVERFESGQFVPQVWFIHGTQNSESHAFKAQLQALADKYAWLKTHVAYSNPLEDDQHLQQYQTLGRISTRVLMQILPFGNYDFYLCGPDNFMQTMYMALRDTGIDSSRIYYEFFGEGSLLGDTSEDKTSYDIPDSVGVHFASSNISTQWSTDTSLLNLAEENDLSPHFGCRSGSCGLCATPVINGDFCYPTQPAYTPNDGEVLICCAKPTAGNETIIIDL